MRQDRMRVVEVYLRNFKSVRETTLPLGSFTCLIGPNNSGKTNLLDALLFLQQAMSRGLPQAIDLHGGMKRLRHYGAGAGEGVEIRLKFCMEDNPRTHWTYEIAFQKDGEVEKEVFAETTGSQKTTHLKVIRDGTHRTTVVQRRSDGSESTVRTSSIQNLYLAHPSDSNAARATAKWISNWRFYRFSPDRLKTRGPAHETNELDRDGRNFASYVHSLQSRHRRTFHRIESQLMKSFPEIEELASPLIGQDTVVSVKEKWFDAHAEGTQLSDGLVGYLAHLVASYGPTAPTFLVFEEPENYVHARLMERLVAMMKEGSEETQTLITTHSVTLLNLLELKDIRLVSRNDGATCVESFEAREELKAALRDYALGDAYFSGALGGVPD